MSIDAKALNKVMEQMIRADTTAPDIVWMSKATLLHLRSTGHKMRDDISKILDDDSWPVHTILGITGDAISVGSFSD